MPPKSAESTAQLMAGSAPIARRKLGDEIRERLLELIESGKLQPGDPLPSERELMANYGVGRPAVREALQSLQGLGLVAISHGERARVLGLTPESMFGQIERSAQHLLSTSPQTLEHLKEARMMFETAMVRLAAAKATSDDINCLRSILERQEQSRKNSIAFMEADIAFHEKIAALSGNPLLAAVSSAMLRWLANVHRELVRLPGRETATLQEHHEILDQIAKHRPEAAAVAMANHLTRVVSLYRQKGRGAASTAKPRPRKK
jgi:GntR family transcriptional regulator, sialic acid-inducible nan operon repressor